MRAIRRMFWNVTGGLRNLWEWFPIIWRDNDGDWTWLVFMLEFKLNRMARAHATNKWHTNSNHYAKQLRLCVALCNRIRLENYGSEFKTKRHPPLGPWLFSSVHNSSTRKDYADYMIGQDIALLTKLMSKHLRCWWL